MARKPQRFIHGYPSAKSFDMLSKISIKDPEPVPEPVEPEQFAHRGCYGELGSDARIVAASGCNRPQKYVVGIPEDRDRSFR